MGRRKGGSIALGSLLAGALAFSGGPVWAAERNPMTPEVASKVETVRRQQDQRITPEKRQSAVEALKAERLKLLKAKQDAEKQPAPAENQEK